MQPVIRPLVASDAADWRRLWTEYLEFYETRLPEAVYASTFDRLTGNDPHDFHGLLACIEGKPVGLAHYLFHRSCWKVENICYLQDLYVSPKVRGHGVGRALIQAVYDAADAAGAPQVWWLTQEFNTTARHLYDRIGRLTPFVRYVR